MELNKEFFEDIKRVSEVGVYTHGTNSYYKIDKKDVLKRSEKEEILYLLTRDIYPDSREVMIVN